MAEQPGERRVIAEVGEELISLMVPDVDPELVQLMLSCAARSAAGDHVELLVLIRDAGIDRAQLRAILGLNQEALSADGGNPRPPVQ